MAQQVGMIHDKSDDLSVIPRIRMVKGENQLLSVGI